MAEKLGIDSSVHELKLGSSFEGGPVAYHSIRYDFKPASVDTTQVANVDIGEGHSVTVTLPHVEGSGTAHTVYKGNKKPCQKECVIIIDHESGEITLEKLATNIQLKKTRIEGSSKASLHTRPHTPTEKTKAPAPSPKKKKHVAPPSGGQANPSPQPSVPTQQVAELRMKDPVTAKDDLGSRSSDSSLSSSSDSDSDMDISPPHPSAGPDMPPASLFQSVAPSHKSFHSTLSQDLQLSDSGSDSD